MKKYFLIVLGIFICMIIPKTVFAQQYNRNASVGRSAVMNTSSVYYYTDWKLLSDNSLNSTPIPYSGGDYYHMGSEYSFPITLVGDTSFRGQVKIPVVANTIYNFQLMNGLGANDMKFGLHQNWGVYGNLSDITVQNSVWECQTYPHLGVAHNYCNYVIDFTFHLSEPWTGAYNLNVAVLDTTGNRSAYYYSGYDSNGNAIEFPVASQNSGYPTLQPSLTMTSTGGSSGSGDNTEEILDGITDATDAITSEIQESYENLVKSQEVCSSFVPQPSSFTNGYKLDTSSGNLVSNSSWAVSDYISITDSTIIKTIVGRPSYGAPYCFYDSSKTKMNCYDNNSLSTGFIVPVVANSSYFRFTYRLDSSSPMFSFDTCQNGNQAIHDSINDSNVNDSSSIASGLLEDAQFTDKGLTGLVATVLDFINDVFDSTCTPLSMQLPFVNTTLNLPCMSTIYTTYFPDIFSLYQLITTGFIAYRIIINLFDKVKKAQDPEYDKVEVLEL